MPQASIERSFMPDIASAVRPLILNRIRDTKALFVDGGGTLWDGKLTVGVARGLLRKRLDEGRGAELAVGTLGLLRSWIILKTGDPITSDARALKQAYKSFVRMGATKDELYELSRAYIDRHVVGQVTAILDAIEMPKILLTVEGSVAALVAKEKLGLSDAVANEVVFGKGGILREIRIKLRDGGDKLLLAKKAAWRYGILLGECTYIANAERDIPLMKEVGLPISAPGSAREVVEVAKLSL